MTDSEYDFDFVSIGSGPAGQRGAIQAAKLGKRAALIERRHTVGGVCIETGTIPSKTFREAIVGFTGPAGGDLAWRGPASKRPTAEQLFDRVESVVCRETEIVARQLERNGVTVLHGSAKFVDTHTVTVKSEEGSRIVTAKHFLIAVGSVPTSPPGIAADGKTILTSDQITQLTELPRTVAVVGSGVIGIEYASMFGAMPGTEVTVIDKRERPLEFLDSEIVDEMIHQMRNRDVTFRLGEGVEKLEIREGPPRRAVVTLESGKRIVTDIVLFSVGRQGATADLNLKAATIDTDNRGRIAVNEHLQTNANNIYAAGDVIGFPSLAATSGRQGRLAATHAFDAPPPRGEFILPLGIYAIPEISMVGQTEKQLTDAKVPYETGIARYREIARGQILGDDSGLLKMLFHRENKKLLGVHAIGTGATELIHIGQAVLGLGGTLDYFLDTVFNYPTLAECYQVAALDAYNKLSM